MNDGRVTTEVDGQTYIGRYVISGKVVTVSMPGVGSKSTQIGGSPVESIARLLLRRIVRPACPSRAQPGAWVRSWTNRSARVRSRLRRVDKVA